MQILGIFYYDDKNNNVLLNKLNEITNFDAQCIFKPKPKLIRAIRRMHLKSGLPGIGIWFLDWANKIDKYNICICIANNYSVRILKWIKRKNPNIRCINYYWDNIEISSYPVIQDSDIENWTFSYNDAKMYQMNYNPQFYVTTINLKSSEILYDITYIGADREGKLTKRSELVNFCYNTFQKLGLKSFFYYVTNSKEISQEICQNKRMPEQQFYDITSKGIAILDLVETGNEWHTLRPLLALSNKKKLITNNSAIIHERYYKKENIFILGYDDINTLKNFLDIKFSEYNNNELNYYEAKNWIERFTKIL